MPKAVDEHTDTKFYGSDAEGAEYASENERCIAKETVDGEHHRKADAACHHHARMGITAPDDLQKSVSNAAEQHFDGKQGKRISAKAAAEKEKRTGWNFHAFSTSFLRAFSSRSHDMALARPPISSIRPSFTASSPFTIEPTSVAISSVRKIRRRSASSVI